MYRLPQSTGMHALSHMGEHTGTRTHGGTYKYRHAGPLHLLCTFRKDLQVIHKEATWNSVHTWACKSAACTPASVRVSVPSLFEPEYRYVHA